MPVALLHRGDGEQEREDREPPGQHAGDHDELTEAPELVGVAECPHGRRRPEGRDDRNRCPERVDQFSASECEHERADSAEAEVGDLIAGQ